MTMTLTEALKIAKPGFGLKQMIKALSIHSWQNTPEEIERLEAAKIVQRNLKKIKYDGPKNGYVVRK